MEMNGRDYWLADDGTVDTVVDVICLECNVLWRERVSHEAAWHYRNLETGEMIDFAGMVRDHLDGEPCQYCES